MRPGRHRPGARGRLLSLDEARAVSRGMVALRDARSWTGADLAAVLGEKTDWVRGREQGGTRVTEPEAERIAAALGTTTAGLIAAGQRKKAS